MNNDKKTSIYRYSSEFSYTILPSFIHVICLYITKTSVRREKGEKVAIMIVFHYFVKLKICNYMFCTCNI